MDFSSENDYRNLLKAQLSQLKHSLGKSFSTQNLADRCGIQRTYLLKVLNQGAHLNDDQLYLASEYLKFSDKEKIFVSLLHQYQRSDQKARRGHLKNQIETFRKKNSKVDENLQTQIIHKDELDLHFVKYFLTPRAQLIHMLLTIERYQKDPSKIKTAIGISDTEFQNAIDRLFQMKLIVQKGEFLVSEQSQFFLSSNSDLFEPYHLYAKTQALSQLKNVSPEEKNSNSTMFSCSQETWHKVRARFVQFMKEVENLVVEDKNPEAVYQLSVDLFPWTSEEKK